MVPVCIVTALFTDLTAAADILYAFLPNLDELLCADFITYGPVPPF